MEHLVVVTCMELKLCLISSCEMIIIMVYTENYATMTVLAL